MLAAILAFISQALPGIGKVFVDGYKAKLDSETSIEATRASLAS
jgi:hypothetical protein